VKSTNPLDLRLNHQVLAYGYELAGDRLTLRLLDPNFPRRDDATLSLGTGDRTKNAITVPPAGLKGSETQVRHQAAPVACALLYRKELHAVLARVLPRPPSAWSRKSPTGLTKTSSSWCSGTR